MFVYWFYLLALCVLYFFIFICKFLLFFCLSFSYSYVLYFYLRCLFFHLTSTFTGPQGRAVSIIASYMVSPGAKSRLGGRLSWSEVFVAILRFFNTTGRTVWGPNPGGERDFPHPSRPALGPTQPPIQCVPGLSRVNQPGRGVDHPPPSSAKFEGGVELYIYFPSGPSLPVLGWTSPLLYFTLLSSYSSGKSSDGIKFSPNMFLPHLYQFTVHYT